MAPKIIDLTGPSPTPPEVNSPSSANPPTNVETTRNLLIKAIGNAHDSRLRTVLKNILNKYGRLVEELLVEELLVPQSAVNQREEGSVDSEDITMEESSLAASEISLSENPLRLRFATCKNCEQEFDVTENDSDACEYHPGEMERDDDWFVDEDDWPRRDSDDEQKEYPQGYIWTCCDQRGDEECCEVSRHEESGYLTEDV